MHTPSPEEGGGGGTCRGSPCFAAYLSGGSQGGQMDRHHVPRSPIQQGNQCKNQASESCRQRSNFASWEANHRVHLDGDGDNAQGSIKQVIHKRLSVRWRMSCLRVPCPNCPQNSLLFGRRMVRPPFESHPVHRATRAQTAREAGAGKWWWAGIGKLHPIAIQDWHPPSPLHKHGSALQQRR